MRDGQQRSGDVARGGRAAALVVDDAQAGRARGEAQHGPHEFGRGAVDPGRAQDHVARRCAAHRLLARELGGAVDAERTGRVVLA